MKKNKDIEELGKLAQLFAGIAGHKESTAVGAAIIGYGLMDKMFPAEWMDLLNEPLGIAAAAVLMLYKGKI